MAELFRNQVRFFGKHGVYAEELSPDNAFKNDETKPDAIRFKRLFNRIIDVYMIGALVGFVYKEKAPQDGNEQTKNIMGETLSGEHDRMMFTYQLIMLLDKDSEPDLNERIRRAFSSDEEVQNKGFALFNDYARGGIERLHTELIEGAATADDLTRNLMDFMDDFHDRFYSSLEDVDLESMLP